MSTLKPLYGTAVAIGITLTAPLATSSTLVAGRESDVVVETTELTIDEIISGEIQVNTGAAPTVNTLIQVYVWGQINDTPTYPEVGTAGTRLTGADANATFASTDARNAACRLISQVVVPATTSLKHPIAPIGIAQFFGGVLPKRWGLFVTQNTGQNLNTANSALQRMPVQYQSV